jgi:hypothetical protein
VLYVNQHPADTVDERRRGSIKLGFHPKAWGVKQRLGGTGHFEPFCLIMEIAILVFTAPGPFRLVRIQRRYVKFPVVFNC